jgi:hypothetical protein
VDRIGFENWDPFAEPKHPIEIRKDPTQRTIQQLVSQFLRNREDHKGYSQPYANGALECAHGLMRGEERFVGMYEFCVWYHKLKLKEGKE